MKSKVCGYYKIEAVNKNTGKSTLLADWFPNLITNIGLDRIATDVNFMNYCHVGTASTAPTVNDTALGAFVGSNNTITTGTYTVNSTSPYYISHIRVYRFNAGVAAGNLSEVGIGWSATGTGSVLFSRALILDTYGDPTTITVLSDEYLDVTYEYRFYPFESDITGSITLTGNIGGTYGYTIRPASISTIVRLFGQATAIYPVHMGNKDAQYYAADAYYRSFDGGIGSITGVPSGNSGGDLPYTQGVVSSYVAGTYTLTFTLTANITDWNLASGIKSILFVWGPRWYQVEFDTAIPKTSEDVLTLTFTHTWGRV